jgi:hypothetical protein
LVVVLVVCGEQVGKPMALEQVVDAARKTGASVR